LETSQIAIARNSKGVFFVGGKNGKIGVFDSMGKYLRAVGGRGGGPGEFQGIWQMYVGLHDSLIVHDLFARRITVFDPDVRRAVRTFKLFDHRGLLPRRDGSFITSGSIATRSNAGLSMHIVSGIGAVLQSASADSAVFRKQPERMLGRSLSMLNNDVILAAPMHRYRLELWSYDLKLKSVLEREVSWFPPLSDELLLDVPSRTPLPMQLMSVVPSGQDGIVVADLLSGSRSFKADPALVGRKGEIPSSAIASYSALNAYVDTTIEFIDLKNLAVMATRRYPGRYFVINQDPSPARAPLFCLVRETDRGTEIIEIVQFDLARRNAGIHPQ